MKGAGLDGFFVHVVGHVYVVVHVYERGYVYVSDHPLRFAPGAVKTTASTITSTIRST